LEAASLPRAVPIEPTHGSSVRNASDAAFVAGRLALGLAAGLVAVLVPGQAGRLTTEPLTWRALLGG
jgi:hypothetical protein